MEGNFQIIPTKLFSVIERSSIIIPSQQVDPTSTSPVSPQVSVDTPQVVLESKPEQNNNNEIAIDGNQNQNENQNDNENPVELAREKLALSYRQSEVYRSSILESWALFTMKLLSKQGATWGNLTMVVHLAAANPVQKRRTSIPGEDSSLSRLTMARRKSLILQEMMSPHWVNRRRFSELIAPNSETIAAGAGAGAYDDGYGSGGNDSDDDSNYRSDQEDDEFYERRAVGDDRVIFNPVTLQAFDSITNQEYNPLAPLLNDSEHYDILGAIEPVIRDTMSEFEFDPNEGKNKTLESLMKPLTTLSLVLAEVISTEATFVADILTLNSLLSDLRYSTLASVKQFVDSKYYTGISTATETLKITHTQFLKSMRFLEPKHVTNKDDIEEEFAILFSNTTDQCQSIFDSFTRFTPFFSLFSQFIVNHDGLSLLYQTLSSQDENFKEFLMSCERNVNEQLMSLIIKPVQRLPRYVLLTKEIQHRLKKFRIIHEEIRAIEDCEDREDELNQNEDLSIPTTRKHKLCGSRFHRICGLELCSQTVLQMMGDCAQECNNAVRQHQDNLRMHQLHEMYREAGTEVSIVRKDVALLKEGELIRHHRGSSETHLIQLFSNQLITASRTLRGIKLQRRFPLTENSNLSCFPVPPKSTGSILKTWFVLIADDKSIFFEAKTPNEMMQWVSLINEQLKENHVIRDLYNLKAQLSLINSIMSDIKRRIGTKKLSNNNNNNNSQETSMKSSSITLINQFDESSLRDVQYLQTGWWRLLLILEELTLREGEQIALRWKRLIEKQCKEVASQLMLTIVDKKNESTPIQSLLFNNSLHYFITSGIVFEYQPPYSVTNLEIYDRPLIMKIFLLSDVLIGAYVESANEPVTYSFHILIQDLEFSDKIPDGSSIAIMLMDKSKPTKRRLSLLPFGGGECAKRVIHLSSIEEKMEWMSLLFLTKRGYEEEKSTKVDLNKLKSIPLESLSTNVSGIGWEYESSAGK